MVGRRKEILGSAMLIDLDLCKNLIYLQLKTKNLLICYFCSVFVVILIICLKYLFGTCLCYTDLEIYLALLSMKFQLLITIKMLKMKIACFQTLSCCIYHANKC